MSEGPSLPIEITARKIGGQPKQDKVSEWKRTEGWQGPVIAEIAEPTKNKTVEFVRGLFSSKSIQRHPIEQPGIPREEIIEGKLDNLLSALRNVLAKRQQQTRKHDKPNIQIAQYDKLDPYTNTYQPMYEDRWTEPQFNLEKHVRQEQGKFVEFGGPTINGYELFPYPEMYRYEKVSVSNVKTEYATSVQFKNPQTLEEIASINHLDQELDAEKELPFNDGSLPGLLSKSLPSFVYDNYIPEAYRVIKPHGILVMEGIATEHIEAAGKAGFTLVSYIRQEFPKRQLKEERLKWNAVFQKK